jgi:alginate O-acetyltransferase complex protein AlgF
MRLRFTSIFIKLALGSMLFFLNSLVMAQPAGLLYDPEPPVDSAYVRVVLAAREGVVDVMVDGRMRVQKLASGEASEYMVLPAGKHTIALHPTGKSAAHFSTSFEVVKGRAMTLAFTTLKPGTVPVMFEDKANSNKLKALLAVYNLDAKAGLLDVLTADGNTKVFSSVAYGTSASLPVNPISIDLIAVKIGDKVPQTRASLIMTQGGTYSILLLPGDGGKLLSNAVQNKIERYTGK